MSQRLRTKKLSSSQGFRRYQGSWKIAYADFVTAMMAFFMVLWIMGLSDETKAVVAGYFNDPLGFMKNEPRSKTVIMLPGLKTYRPGRDKRHGTSLIGDEKELRKLHEQLKGHIARLAMDDREIADLLSNVELAITEEGLRMEFLEASRDAFFQTGSTEPLAHARRLFDGISPLIRRSGRKVVLEGHTDSAPYPSQTYTNWELSAGRANAFRRALAAGGVEPSQFESVTGYADTRLRKKDEPTHFSNRRVSLLIPFRTHSELTKEATRDEISGSLRNSISIGPEPVRVKD